MTAVILIGVWAVFDAAVALFVELDAADDDEIFIEPPDWLEHGDK